jgi:RND family efflux transporter MFP subunit
MRGALAVLLLMAPAALAQPLPAAAPDLRAQLVPRHQAQLSGEVAGRIAQMPLREGDTFREGAVLVEFDCAAHRARLQRATALRDRARAQAAAARRLDRSGANSRLDVEVAQAEAAAAEAEVAAARVPVERCSVTAPFAGRVVQLHAARHQFVAEGAPLLDVLDHRELEVELLVPSHWLLWLRTGTGFALRLDETGRDYPVRVERLGARIDPVSQTVKLFGRIEGEHPELLAGMSGTAIIAPPAGG